MNITPVDLRKQVFKKALRGYDCHEVNGFLEMVSNELEDFLREHALLTERLRELDGKIEDYRNMEKTLKETLVSAQKTVDELRKNAEKEAALILQDAKVEAEGIVSEARNEIARLRGEITSLRSERESFLAQFEGLIQAEQKVLECYRDERGKVPERIEMSSLLGIFEKIE